MSAIELVQPDSIWDHKCEEHVTYKNLKITSSLYFNMSRLRMIMMFYHFMLKERTSASQLVSPKVYVFQEMDVNIVGCSVVVVNGSIINEIFSMVMALIFTVHLTIMETWVGWWGRETYLLSCRNLYNRVSLLSSGTIWISLLLHKGWQCNLARWQHAVPQWYCSCTHIWWQTQQADCCRDVY